MTSTVFEPAAAPQVPARVQAARVFCLARLLTLLTAVASVLTIVVVRWCERHVLGRDIGLDQALLNWRTWPFVFIFWSAVFTTARRHLMLDTRP